MIIRAALCPSPPLLARELTGRDAVLPELRAACAAAVTRLLATGPDSVLVVGGGAVAAAWDPGDRLDLAGYAPAPRGRGPTVPPAGTQAGPPAGQPSPPRGKRGVGLPLAVGIGAMLLDEAGYAGPRVLRSVSESSPADDCVRLGALLAAAGGRTGLLVVGDGTAKRTPKAPGHFDERAGPFDASVEKAVRSGDMAALAALDAGLARDLMATGRAAWQVLAGALGAGVPGAADVSGGAASPGDVLYSGAPFGVWYLVAVLDPPDLPELGYLSESGEEGFDRLY